MEYICRQIDDIICDNNIPSQKQVTFLLRHYETNRKYRNHIENYVHNILTYDFNSSVCDFQWILYENNIKVLKVILIYDVEIPKIYQ